MQTFGAPRQHLPGGHKMRPINHLTLKQCSAAGLDPDKPVHRSKVEEAKRRLGLIKKPDTRVPVSVPSLGPLVEVVNVESVPRRAIPRVSPLDDGWRPYPGELTDAELEALFSSYLKSAT